MIRQILRPLLAATLLFSLKVLPAAEPIDIGSRRELFVDHHLIGSLSGVRLVLHRPEPREIVIRFDQPWEGLYSGYETVLKDGETYRFYYRGMPEAKHDLDTEVTWKHGADVSRLAGRPVRLRMVMKDADLYSFRFSGKE